MSFFVIIGRIDTERSLQILDNKTDIFPFFSGCSSLDNNISRYYKRILWEKEGIIVRRAEEEEEEGERKARLTDMERLKLGPTKLWTGLVLHHKDIFVSHVIRN